ncbi:hypothetical protein ACRZ5S_06730 [Vibrio scophthalmi]|uniref:hypothetical protein n=1 Tax=Vibrio scophthalmi TaxID=45658 RepID=UPI003EC102DA
MNKKILSLLIGASLIGCGSDSSGDDNTSSDKNTLTGLAIDGYVGGATVFLDENFNGKLDAGEPSAITVDTTGTYAIPVSVNAVCNDHAPVVVKVPVGALDTDAPGGVVDKAYTMTLPPVAFRSLTAGNVTPITSKVWDQVAAQAKRDGITLTCSTLANPTSTASDWMENQIKAAEDQVAAELGITTADMYGDYVATNNTALHNTAKVVAEDLKVVEELKADPANDGKDLFLVNGAALAAYGISDDASYIVASSLTSYGSFSHKLKEKITAIDGTLIYESDITIHESESFYNKVGSAYFGTSDSCEMVDNATKKSGIGAWKVETTRIDNMASQLSECGAIDSVIQKIYTKQLTSGVEYETSVSQYASNVVDDDPNVGSDMDSDLSNYFANVTGLMAGHEAFDEKSSFPLGVTSWSRSYYDYVDSNSINTFNELVTYNSDNYWYKEREQSVNEFFCFRSLKELNGEPFDSATSPIDFWQEIADRNGDAVWIKVGGSISDVKNNPMCDMNINIKSTM